MVLLAAQPPSDLHEGLACYAAVEPLLESLPVIVFLGNSTQDNTSANPSRIQAHVYSLAGFRSFGRLIVAPNTPSYAAVAHLSSTLQGNETYRGLAVALLSYFATISKGTQQALEELAESRGAGRRVPAMFDEMHAGQIATRLELVDSPMPIANLLMAGIKERVLSWVDVDLVLPAGSFAQDAESACAEYRQHAELVDVMGTPTFLASSKLRRAPSKSSSRVRATGTSQDFKASVRNDLIEFVQTEGHYVDKLRDLTLEVAPRYRHVLGTEEGQKLFPPSLQDMLPMHEEFAAELRRILPAEVDSSVEDDDHPWAEIVASFSHALSIFLPRFKLPYQRYLRSSVHFSTVIVDNTKRDPATFGHLVQQEEQKLRSSLIEPVQRLPRYSLLIDNMVNHLPVDLAVVKVLLKARDVINETCALDRAIRDVSAHVVRYLSHAVSDWPQFFQMTGRVITTVDVQELRTPYGPEDHCWSGILLLFPGRLLLLRKTSPTALSARGLFEELNGHAEVDMAIDQSLAFDQVYDLASCRFSESADGQLIYLSENPAKTLEPIEILSLETRVFELQAPYSGKASRFGNEMAMSRIELRYPEHVRDASRWQLRTIEAPGLGMVVAVTDQDNHRDVGSMGPIQIYVQSAKSPSDLLAERSDCQIAVCISCPKPALYKLEVECFDGARASESCRLEHLVERIQQRVGEIVSLLQRADNVTRAAHQIALDAGILQSIKLADPPRSRNPRSRSPVKLISNIIHDSSGLAGRSRQVLADKMPLLAPSLRNEDQKLDESPRKLDVTLQVYIVALRSRAGNIVGKCLQNRATADELAVNELYNGLLEHPERVEMTAVVAVDVLFSAFEKFLRCAWTENLGPLIDSPTVSRLQRLLDSGQAPAFASGVHQVVQTMSEQNRQALASVIGVVAELLDAAGNDGDRGALVASFCEALFGVPNPLTHIQLLDRLVDDHEIFFPLRSSSCDGTLGRVKSTNTSSLRRRLGLMTPNEDKASPLWRSLSKNSHESSRFGSVSSTTSRHTVRSAESDQASPRQLPQPPPQDSVTIVGYSPRKQGSAVIPSVKGLSERPWPPNERMMATSPKDSISGEKSANPPAKSGYIQESMPLQEPVNPQIKFLSSQDSKPRQECKEQHVKTIVSPKKTRAVPERESCIPVSVSQKSLTSDIIRPRTNAASTNRSSSPIKSTGSSSTPPRPGSSRESTTSRPQSGALRAEIEHLQRRLETQEAEHLKAFQQADRTTKAVQMKMHALNKLYLEANAENEALYDRFNDELARVLGRVRAYEGVTELQQQLHTALEEAATLRKQNAALKRKLVEQST